MFPDGLGGGETQDCMYLGNRWECSVKSRMDQDNNCLWRHTGKCTLTVYSLSD